MFQHWLCWRTTPGSKGRNDVEIEDLEQSLWSECARIGAFPLMKYIISDLHCKYCISWERKNINLWTSWAVDDPRNLSSAIRNPTGRRKPCPSVTRARKRLVGMSTPRIFVDQNQWGNDGSASFKPSLERTSCSTFIAAGCESQSVGQERIITIANVEQYGNLRPNSANLTINLIPPSSPEIRGNELFNRLRSSAAKVILKTRSLFLAHWFTLAKYWAIIGRFIYATRQTSLSYEKNFSRGSQSKYSDIFQR